MLKSYSFLLDLIDKELHSLDFNCQPRNLYEPIEYSLSVGGKRIRPVLALMGANLFGDSLTNVLKPAIGVEIFHNFTLLHDDLMDKASVRRGMPTVHEKWNPNVAILSGDAMLIEAYRYISDSSDGVVNASVLSLFSQTSMQVCQGQQYDMDFEQRFDVSEEEYMEMIRLKTAVLLACSLKIGAILSGSSDDDAALLYDFGINIGLAFQLKDDFLDVYGDSEVFGKSIGGDILSNKKTFMLITALNKATGEQKEELLSWISRTEFDSKEKIDAVTRIYNELYIRNDVEARISKYYQMAVDALSRITVADDRKMELKAIAEKLNHRNS